MNVYKRMYIGLSLHQIYKLILYADATFIMNIIAYASFSIIAYASAYASFIFFIYVGL